MNKKIDKVDSILDDIKETCPICGKITNKSLIKNGVCEKCSNKIETYYMPHKKTSMKNKVYLSSKVKHICELAADLLQTKYVFQEQKITGIKIEGPVNMNAYLKIEGEWLNISDKVGCNWYE